MKPQWDNEDDDYDGPGEELDDYIANHYGANAHPNDRPPRPTDSQSLILQELKVNG